MVKRAVFAIFLWCLMPFACWPEGTKQIAPFATADGKLCLDKSRNDFAFFDASPEFRLNIYIANPNEKFYLGLGRVILVDQLFDVKFQIRDPAGNIIIGPAPVPKSGQGFISTYFQDTVGPFVSAGGYNPITCTPTVPGNYSLEFYYPPDEGATYTFKSYVKFEFFDITVVDAANRPIPGRIWSKAWQFNCGLVEPPPTKNRFFGKMYILSDDSIVTSINCNGFVGGTFSISSNKTGCSATGTIAVDRQSRTGFHTYPQYKVFLTDPDSTIFPTGQARPGITLPVTIENHCASGGVDIGIKVTQDGIIEILIELDPNPGADPRDVKITANVWANPGGNGYNIIRWNGVDGLGVPVANGESASAIIRFIHGISHLPIYDIEYNDNGYIVDVVRPAGPRPDIYWDDSLLPGNTTTNLIGCIDQIGCHIWSIDAGDTNTINSWWYVASSSAPAVGFTVKRSPGALGLISGDPTFCLGGISRTYTIAGDPNSSSYTWSYSGTGAVINGTSTTAYVDFGIGATSGVLSVSGNNLNCGSGPVSTLPVSFYPPPTVTLSNFDSICYNEPPLILRGGSPSGGDYFIDGLSQATIDPGVAGIGSHLLTYVYTDNHGCKNSDTALIFVKTGKECEIFIWVPSAFSPNGDGLNDTFHAVSGNIRAFSMNIYSRSGQLVFSSSDPAERWDGTYRGSPCPGDTYAYIIIYQSSNWPPENTTLTGTVTIVR